MSPNDIVKIYCVICNALCIVGVSSVGFVRVRNLFRKEKG